MRRPVARLTAACGSPAAARRQPPRSRRWSCPGRCRQRTRQGRPARPRPPALDRRRAHRPAVAQARAAAGRGAGAAGGRRGGRRLSRPAAAAATPRALDEV
eukprot:scaffold27544_cov86-Isochrysis_galbana.AAC.2